MTETSRLHLKGLLRRQREEIRARHDAGALGGQISTGLTDLYDRVIVAAYQIALEQIGAAARPALLENLALVAIGGYRPGGTGPHPRVDPPLPPPQRAGGAGEGAV